jgi:hypothetical protein
MGASADVTNDPKAIENAFGDLEGLLGDLDQFLGLMKRQIADIRKNPDQGRKQGDLSRGEPIGIAKSGKDFADIEKRLGKAITT